MQPRWPPRRAWHGICVKRAIRAPLEHIVLIASESRCTSRIHECAVMDGWRHAAKLTLDFCNRELFDDACHRDRVEEPAP